jgi:cell division protease FtsH
MIDEEVHNIVNEQYVRAKEILMENAEKHNLLADQLLKAEVIYTEDVERIFGKRQWISRSEEIMEKQNGEAKKEESKVEH